MCGTVVVETIVTGIVTKNKHFKRMNNFLLPRHKVYSEAEGGGGEGGGEGEGGNEKVLKSGYRGGRECGRKGGHGGREKETTWNDVGS